MTKLIVVMGVSGSGKTVVGIHIAKKLGVEFVDGDDLHPPENVERMKVGIKLDDETRRPWLAAICKCAETHLAAGDSVVIACSALKRKYRDQLRTVSQPVVFVFLNGPREIIEARMNARQDHYMPTSLLDSQFADLENPEGERLVVPVDINQPLADMLSSASVGIHDQVV